MRIILSIVVIGRSPFAILARVRVFGPDLKIKSSFLNINDKQLEYLTYGSFSDNSPVLILLHEGLGSVAMWRQIPQLIYEKTNLNVKWEFQTILQIIELLSLL